MTGTVRREWRPGRTVDVRRTLAPLSRGRYDPTFRTTPDGAVWRTMLTPDGPATQRIASRPAEAVVVGESWGAGAAWAADRLPAALGADDGAAAKRVLKAFTPRFSVSGYRASLDRLFSTLEYPGEAL